MDMENNWKSALSPHKDRETDACMCASICVCVCPRYYLQVTFGSMSYDSCVFVGELMAVTTSQLSCVNISRFLKLKY